jgi:hypothetical protein
MESLKQTCIKYTRRRPELTTCYQIIQENLNTFITERETESRPLPEYIIKEFEAFLKCGIPAHGFLRLKCDTCSEELIVAFSCKKRGFCPSCAAKRKTEAASHLVDNVLPHAPYRQFVMSFPISMRYWLQTNKKLFAKIHSIVIKEIQNYYIKKAESIGINNAKPGAVSFTQRWGGALNLNPHLHILFLDGVYTIVKDKPKFHNVPTISDEDVAELITQVSSKIIRYFKRKGYLDKQGALVNNPDGDDLYTENDSLRVATKNSIFSKIAFGPNAGKKVTKIGAGFGFEEEIPMAKGRLCYNVNNFSLHANTAIKTRQRDRLFKLIEYIARGPISDDRLEILEDGMVEVTFKAPWSNGQTGIRLTQLEFLEKLSALIPPPKSHLVKWSGVFAPNYKYRKDIILNPKIKKTFQFGEDTKDGLKNSRWAIMLAKVFKIDVTKCNKCGGDMSVVAALRDSHSIERYLKHVGIDHEAPARAPPKYQPGELFFEETPETEYYNGPASSLD